MLQLPLYFWYKSGQHVLRAPVAQWIRASVFGTEGRRFESVRVYHIDLYSQCDIIHKIWVSSSAG